MEGRTHSKFLWLTLSHTSMPALLPHHSQALVSCPQTGVARHALNFKDMSLTGIVADKVAPSCRDGPLAKAIDKSGCLAAWAATAWSKKLTARSTRANLNDFQRFQVKSHKQTRNRLVRTAFRKLKSKK
jgi:large subunit ribosomal protein L14e